MTIPPIGSSTPIDSVLPIRKDRKKVLPVDSPHSSLQIPLIETHSLQQKKQPRVLKMEELADNIGEQTSKKQSLITTAPNLDQHALRARKVTLEKNKKLSQLAIKKMEASADLGCVLTQAADPVQKTISTVRLPMIQGLSLIEQAANFTEVDFEKITDFNATSAENVIDMNLDKISLFVVQTELAFRVPRTLGDGGCLIYRWKCIRNAKQMRTLLQQHHPKLKKQIEALSKRIEEEEKIFKQAAKAYCVTTARYIPRMIKTILKTVSKFTTPIKIAYGWIYVLIYALEDYEDMQDSKASAKKHQFWLDGWKKQVEGEVTPQVASSQEVIQRLESLLKQRKESSDKDLLWLNTALQKEDAFQLIKEQFAKYKYTPQLLKKIESGAPGDRTKKIREELFSDSKKVEFIKDFIEFKETRQIMSDKARQSVKKKLAHLAIEKQHNVKGTLNFEKIRASALFYAELILSLSLVIVETIALSSGVGLIILFPEIAIAFLVTMHFSAALYYWTKHRPNLAWVMVKDALVSVYYPLRQAIVDWRLKNSQIEFLENRMERRALRIALLNPSLDNKKRGVIQNKISKLRAIEEQLNKKMFLQTNALEYWDEKNTILKMHQINADLADICKGTTLDKLVDHIYEALFQDVLKDNDQKLIYENLQLNLDTIPLRDNELSQKKAIKTALLQSLLAKNEGEMVKLVGGEEHEHENNALEFA